MNFMYVCHHYCFICLFDLVMTYDMCMGLQSQVLNLDIFSHICFNIGKITLVMRCEEACLWFKPKYMFGKHSKFDQI